MVPYIPQQDQAEALAYRAALETIREIFRRQGDVLQHDDADCPGDDTCSCGDVQLLNAALRTEGAAQAGQLLSEIRELHRVASHVQHVVEVRDLLGEPACEECRTLSDALAGPALRRLVGEK